MDDQTRPQSDAAELAGLVREVERARIAKARHLASALKANLDDLELHELRLENCLLWVDGQVLDSFADLAQVAMDAEESGHAIDALAAAELAVSVLYEREAVGVRSAEAVNLVGQLDRYASKAFLRAAALALEHQCDPGPLIRAARLRTVEAVVEAEIALNKLSAALEAAAAERDGPEPHRERAGVASGNSNRLPILKHWAIEAWQARQLGMKVTEIAKTLAKKHKDRSITQPRVTEQIQRAQQHAEASGLDQKVKEVFGVPAGGRPARTFDPHAAEAGERKDSRASYIRQKEQQKARDNDSD